MTEKLYYEDAFLGEFEARVLSCTQSCENFEIILDKTAFFGEGGGQSADTGTLNDVNVIDVFEKDGNVIHITKKPMEENAIVLGRVDMNVRLRKMQNHTGEHMVSGAAYKLFGANNFGFHLGEGFFTCDLDVEFSPEQLKKIEDTVNFWILENHKVYTTFYESQSAVDVFYRAKVDFDGRVRIVTIDGCDACACCAPHVSYTGQVGIVKIIDSIRYKGGTRITAACGMDALCDYRMLSEQNAVIRNLLSAKREQATEFVERAVKERDDAKFQAEKYKTLYITECVKRAVKAGEKTVLIEETLDAKALTAGLDLFEGSGAVFCTAGNALSFAVCGRQDSIKELIAQIRQIAGSGGGGRDGFAQGRISLPYKDAKELFLKYLSC
ncbi:MAG: hypothetical protein J6I80_01350 [Clostridia bacterium]|nr:hypothetical protein [Clostridia bacterium]